MKSDEINQFSLSWTYFFKGQIQHFLFLALLLPGFYFFAEPVLTGKTWMGLSDSQWLWFMVGISVGHQVVVALVFRTQLLYSLFSRIFKKADLLIWGIIFMPLLFLRLVSLVGLAITTQGSLGLPLALTLPLVILFGVTAMYTFWSVARYFGIARALGGDHFRQKYRKMPFVRKGAFRYSSNAMYTYGFLILWATALAFQSQAALAGALFQHAYIWVHWYCTEAPDIEVIYNTSKEL